MIVPEFSRPRRLDTIGAGETAVEIEATEAERAALATRFGLIGVDRLTARYTLRQEASGIAATGTLAAAVTQACVVTGEPLPAVVDESFALRFVPESGEAEEEVELGEDALDTMFFEGSAIDLGEAAAETLVLALDPYPRSPKAAAALKEAGVLTEEEARPLGPLAGLKDVLAGR